MRSLADHVPVEHLSRLRWQVLRPSRRGFYDVVGFTSLLAQQTASLALAKLIKKTKCRGWS